MDLALGCVPDPDRTATGVTRQGVDDGLGSQDVTVKAVSDSSDREKLRKLINAGVQLYTTGLDREYEYDADLRGVVLSARAGYDPFALLDVLTTIDSINPESKELTVMMNTHPPTSDRLEKLALKMEGSMDSYASGQSNPKRFRRFSGSD